MSFQMKKCNQVIKSRKTKNIERQENKTYKLCKTYSICRIELVYHREWKIYLSLLSPLKAFNDQPSKKMIACEEKNTLRPEHSSNILLAII